MVASAKSKVEQAADPVAFASLEQRMQRKAEAKCERLIGHRENIDDLYLALRRALDFRLTETYRKVGARMYERSMFQDDASAGRLDFFSSDYALPADIATRCANFGDNEERLRVAFGDDISAYGLAATEKPLARLAAIKRVSVVMSNDNVESEDAAVRKAAAKYGLSKEDVVLAAADAAVRLDLIEGRAGMIHAQRLRKRLAHVKDKYAPTEEQVRRSAERACELMMLNNRASESKSLAKKYGLGAEYQAYAQRLLGK
jgi:hypothetical protein